MERSLFGLDIRDVLSSFGTVYDMTIMCVSTIIEKISLRCATPYPGVLLDYPSWRDSIINAMEELPSLMNLTMCNVEDNASNFDTINRIAKFEKLESLRITHFYAFGNKMFHREIIIPKNSGLLDFEFICKRCTLKPKSDLIITLKKKINITMADAGNVEIRPELDIGRLVLFKNEKLYINNARKTNIDELHIEVSLGNFGTVTTINSVHALFTPQIKMFCHSNRDLPDLLRNVANSFMGSLYTITTQEDDNWAMGKLLSSIFKYHDMTSCAENYVTFKAQGVIPKKLN
jgi:hypothetical protein